MWKHSRFDQIREKVGTQIISLAPEKVQKVWNHTHRKPILYVDQPSIKSIPECNFLQLKCKELCHFWCLKDVLADPLALTPLRDNGAKHLKRDTSSLEIASAQHPYVQYKHPGPFHGMAKLVSMA